MNAKHGAGGHQGTFEDKHPQQLSPFGPEAVIASDRWWLA
jgi:hypothetical protein